MKYYILQILSKIPVLKILVETRKSQTPVRLRHLLQYITKSKVYWPVHHSSLVSSPEKIVIGIDVSPGYMPGCYIQGGGGIVIGDYTQISCNVGIISRNHDVFDISRHVDTEFPSIKIGKYCWIGMNVTILPGVQIPDYCVIGAGAVVTKSVQKMGSVLVGNPAKVIKILDVDKVKDFKSEFEYVGFIPSASFEKYRKRELKL
ncbi:acyltransferase [Shewanella sedimentimangrovi]|uniref:Acyltransferase n=1 Tax=Shewanella sedimentimangrovi TaxID=2814293 RepID=A0ABX7QXS1_9GAMM|nr:acyltransferase [Shewanella sedimentimangrovi]QSX36034.1 acyltransferase [Shewanella sedimentimangrovi]